MNNPVKLSFVIPVYNAGVKARPLFFIKEYLNFDLIQDCDEHEKKHG